MFSLKSPSLMVFRQNFQCEVRQHNLRTVYGVEQIPEDTALRQAIDGVDPAELHPAFQVLTDELRSEGLTKPALLLSSKMAMS